jgi:proteic killer suppression protein
MIKSWQHKGLRKFYETGNKSGINPDYAKRLTIILQLLDSIENAEQMNLPGMDFHKLIGDLKNFYSVTVRANWNIIFKMDGEDVTLVDYLDYH